MYLSVCTLNMILHNMCQNIEQTKNSSYWTATYNKFVPIR